MRSIAQWVVGSGVLVLVAISSLPVSTATPIDGALFWRDAAHVTGVLAVAPSDAGYLVQKVEKNTPSFDYDWVLTADHATLTVSEIREKDATSDLLSLRREGPLWTNSTQEIPQLSLHALLRPTLQYGASAFYHTASEAAGEIIAKPVPGHPVDVRNVPVFSPFIEVPKSARDDSPGDSYRYDPPPGHLLRVDGYFQASVRGEADLVLFGWTLDLASPQGTDQVLTGVYKTRDAVTGLPSGTVLRYATLHVVGADFSLDPMPDPQPLYTPVLRYAGDAQYPEGLYHGTHQELAPTGQGLALGGHIVLASVNEPGGDATFVRAAGEADWHPMEAAVLPLAPVPASPIPVIVAAAGLFFAGQFLQGLGRSFAMGAVGLYARLREQTVDANPTRERIYQVIVAEPGLNLSRIVQDLDIGWGTAAYHVQILKRQGRVKELRFLNRVCFFPSENQEEGKQLQTVLLRQPNYRGVMDVLAATPGLSQREVASRTGHARQYISRLVAKMERANLLRAEPSRTGRRYFPLAGPPLPGPILAPAIAAPAPGPVAVQPPPVVPTVQANHLY